MQSRKLGIGGAVVGLIVVVVLFFVLSSSDSSDSTSTSAGTTEKDGVPLITIKNGAAVGGVQDLTFNKGDDIRFDVKSDKAYEIHFHGYNVMKDVKAGGTVMFDVPGTADGIYEAEIEDTSTQIAQITVNP